MAIPNINELKLINFISSKSKEEVAQYKERLTPTEIKVVEQIENMLDSGPSELPHYNKQMISNGLRFKLIQSRTSEKINFEMRDELKGFIDNAVAKVKEVSSDETLSKMAREIENKETKPKGNLAKLLENVKESKAFDDNVVFLTTNERGHDLVLEELAKEPVHGNTLVEHNGSAIIAVSGFCGLNMASIRGAKAEKSEHQIDTIIMLDVSRQMEAFWALVGDLIETSDTKEEFLSKLKAFSEDHLDKEVKGRVGGTRGYIVNFMFRGLESEIQDGESWLSTDERYGRIKEIFDNQRFIYKLIDITDETAMSSLQQALKTNNIKVDTLYVSNVSDSYTEAAPFESYKKGLSYLLEDKTLFVDAVNLRQRVQKNVKEALSSWKLEK